MELFFETDSDRCEYLETLMTPEEKQEYLYWDKDEQYADEYCSPWEEPSYYTRIRFKGYDIYEKKFFVYVEYLCRSYRHHRSFKKKIFFDDFKAFYYFFIGDIYDDVTYYGYHFSQEEIDEYLLDVKLLDTKPTVDTTYDSEDKRLSLRLQRSARIRSAEAEKYVLTKLCLHVAAYETYKDMLTDFPFMREDQFFFAVKHLFFTDPEKADRLIQSTEGYVSDGMRRIFLFSMSPSYCFMDFEHQFGRAATTLLRRTDVPYTCAIGFDDETRFFYKDYTFDVPGFGRGVFRRYYLDIFELAKDMKGDLSGGDFALCDYDIDWSKYKTDDAKLFVSPEVTRYVHLAHYDDAFYFYVAYSISGKEIFLDHYTMLHGHDVFSYLKIDDMDKVETILESVRTDGMYRYSLD